MAAGPPAVSQMRQVQTENTQQARPNIRIAPASQVAAPQTSAATGPVSLSTTTAIVPVGHRRMFSPMGKTIRTGHRPPTARDNRSPMCKIIQTGCRLQYAGQQPQGNQPGNSPANNAAKSPITIARLALGPTAGIRIPR